MSFSISSIEVETAIAMYALHEKKYDQNEKGRPNVMAFYRNVSTLCHLLKNGVDIEPLFGDNDDIKLFDQKHKKFIVYLVNIMEKDLRCTLINDLSVLKKLKDLKVLNVQEGGSEQRQGSGDVEFLDLESSPSNEGGIELPGSALDLDSSNEGGKRTLPGLALNKVGVQTIPGAPARLNDTNKTEILSEQEISKANDEAALKGEEEKEKLDKITVAEIGNVINKFMTSYSKLNNSANDIKQNISLLSAPDPETIEKFNKFKDDFSSAIVDLGVSSEELSQLANLPKGKAAQFMFQSVLSSFGFNFPSSPDDPEDTLKKISGLNNAIFVSPTIPVVTPRKFVKIVKFTKNSGQSKYELLFNHEKDYKNINFYEKDASGNLKNKEDEDVVNKNICDGDNDCAKLMQDCLSGNNINKCKAFMQNEHYYKNAAEAVKAMSIETVTGFLNAYKVNINKETGKIENPKDYMFRLHNYAVANNDKNFNYNDWVNINNNTQLKTFIGYLVDKYNQYKNQPTHNVGHYGVSKVTYSTDSSSHLSPYIRYEVPRKLNNYAMGLGLGNISSFGLPFQLVGGGNDEGKYLSNLVKNGGNADLPFETVRMYEQSLKNSTEIFKQHNIALDEADETHFKNLVEQTKKALSKIQEIHDIASMYASLLINHALNDGEKVTGIMHMGSLIEKHTKAVNKLASLNSKGTNMVAAIEKATSDATFNGANFR